MKIKHPFVTKLTGLIAAKTVGSWMNTLDYKAAFYDPTADLVHENFRGRKIYLFWHEYLLFPLGLRGRANVAMLLSRHSDGEILARAAHHLGFDTVRGSTFRGGSAAVREMLRSGGRMNLAITPDGPRGPRRRLAQGPIYLAARLGLPLVVTGFGYDRPWRLGSWDRFAIPRPWSRARAVVSAEIFLPGDLDRDGVEHYRGRIERLLNRLTCEAEAWAASGTRKIGQVPVRRQPARQHLLRRFDPPATGPESLTGPNCANRPQRVKQ